MIGDVVDGAAGLADEFCAWWRARHPCAWPAGWSLREHRTPRWLRMYSLPDGRRGPAAEDDWDELLRRHRDASSTTLGDGMACWVVVGTDLTDPAPVIDGLELARLAPGAMRPAHPVDVDDVPGLAFAVARCEWCFDELTPLIRASARGDLATLLVANVDPGQIYAPYEGGADLFFAMFCEIDDARRRFAPWLSPRDDGL